MENKRVKLTEIEILSRVSLPLLPGDIVVKNVYMANRDTAEQYKILEVYDLKIPYRDIKSHFMTETWANVEIVRSPIAAAIGIQMTDKIQTFRRLEDRSIADYVRDLEVKV
jgi:hypothetical protein